LILRGFGTHACHGSTTTASQQTDNWQDHHMYTYRVVVQ
jgi:hypothetical protein